MSRAPVDLSLPRFDDLWDYGNPAGTEARFRALLPRAEQSGDASYHAQLLSQIARAQGLQRAFDAAHRTLDEAGPLLHAAGVVAQARWLLERGRLFNSTGEADRARPLFLDAWNVASAHHADAYAIDAAHMLAIVEPPPAQLDWNLRALAMAEASSDPAARRWVGSLTNNLGWSYHDTGDFSAALDMLKRALAWHKEHGDAETIRIARWSVARALRSLGRVDEALSIQQELRAELDDAGQQDGYVDEELGECLLALHRRDDARPHFARAHAALARDPWLLDHEPARLQHLANMART